MVPWIFGCGKIVKSIIMLVSIIEKDAHKAKFGEESEKGQFFYWAGGTEV